MRKGDTDTTGCSLPAGGGMLVRGGGMTRESDESLMTQDNGFEEGGARERRFLSHDGKRRRLGLAILIFGLGLLVLILTGGGAWACVPQPFIFLEPGSSGPPGSEVTVQGLRFGEPDIEIRWQTPEGPTLATASGTDFSVPVTIPQAPAGLYALLVIARAPGGGIDSVQRAVFQVTEEGSSGGSQQLPEEPARGAQGENSGWVQSPSASPSPIGDFAFLAAGGAGLLVLGGLCGNKLAGRRGPGTRRGDVGPPGER